MARKQAEQVARFRVTKATGKLYDSSGWDVDSPSQWDLTAIVTLDSNILELEPWLSIWYYDINNFRSICQNLSELHSGLIPVNLTRNPMGFFKAPVSNTEAFETVRQAMPGPAKDLAAEEMRRIMTEWHGGHSTPGGKCCKKTTGDSQGEQKLMNSLWKMLVFFLKWCENQRGLVFFSKSFESFWKVVCGCFQQ